MKVLVAYASAHGSTQEVADFVGRILNAYSIEVTLLPVQEVDSLDGYDAVVLGSAIHGGLWLQSADLFLSRHAAALQTTPLYFFITCIRVVEEGGLAHVLENYIHRRALEPLNVKDIVAFAGSVNLIDVDSNERWLLALRYDGQDLPNKLNRDFRDWPTIASWANKIAAELKAAPQFTQG